ncbi:MAG TPA: ParB/RepB/Spo0J family partition protein [bacterium]|jgi:ParB family chromosome partitioning protein|nr:ParB/RepB/Spo0J family partition protein [bacterium]MDX9805506.1 ParB/RepB/Spo0J family partition protein [bacterium]HNW15428.1 ParB/RepB/Spo0J family partition protein [bacterium]HNZ53234.1 ParB/RepB/Spo0J family partition protein [bacterium]HOG44301.1 ParB/RepB/Spo0J family partition protein [bacterium]
MIEKRKLGKGLNALIKSSPENDYMVLSIDSIITNKDQPRKRFDEQRLTELAASIKQYGIIQPIVVKKEGAKYRIVAGERRYRAAKMAGLTEIKAILFKGEEDYQISLIENLQREDLNPIEVAEAYTELIKRFSYTQQELSEKVGKSRSEISNCMRLLNLTGKIQDLVRNGTISVGQARPLAVLEKSEQEAVLDKILNKKLTARQVEKIASSKQNKTAEKNASGGYWELQQKELAVHTKAKVSLKEKKTGISVTFDFGTISDFEKFSAIVRKLNK